MTSSLPVYPDVESRVRTVLLAGYAAAGETVKVSTGVPSPRPSEFVRTYLVGGTKETRTSQASRLALDAEAASEARAVQLLNLGRSILEAEHAAFWGYDEFLAPANLPDPLTSLIRYTCTFEIRTRLSFV